MITDLYKVLFEVQLLHEYYLTDPDQSSVFDPTNIADTGAYVATRQAQGRPSVTAAVQFVIPAQTQELFRNYRLCLINTYTGFKVVGKVTASTLSDGTTAYSPAVTLPADCNLLFLLQSADGALGAITSGRMQRQIGSLYYFNNGAIGGTKSSPVLSNPIATWVDDGTYAYQQGELAVKDGSIQFAYYATGNTAALFGPVSGDGFANESDRLLVPLLFNYTFSPTDKVTSASFVLKDVSGKVLKTINAMAVTPLGVVSLDFSADAQGNPLALLTLPEAGLSDPLLYTLTVTGSPSGYNKTFNLVFYDNTAELTGCWGMIQVQTAVNDASYSLLDVNGRLRSPVFQIRCKSTPTFRQYANNAGAAIQAPTSLNNILVAAGKQLVTIQPVPLTYMPYFFVPNQWAPATGATSGMAPPASAGGTAPAGVNSAAAGAAAPGGGTSPTSGAAAAGSGNAATAGQPAAGAGNAPPPAKPKGTVYLPGPEPGGSMAFANNQLSSVILVPVSTLFPLQTQTASSTNS